MRGVPERRAHQAHPDGEITEVRRRDRVADLARFARLPRVVVTASQIRALPIDPRVAFVLSHIDGQSSVETLVDVTGFAADELRSVLARLVQLGAITIG